MIKSVSYSRMAVFEKCPQRAKLAWVDKIPEPVDDSGKESPLDRGTRIHELAEQYVRGDLAELPKELAKLEDNFIQLRDLHDNGNVTLEELWCFNDAWQRVEDKDWDNIWLRIKGDALVHDDTFGVITVIDYKTGKKIGNEVKHFDQVTLYAVAAQILFPDAYEFRVELWYLDQGEVTEYEFTAESVQKKFERYNERLQRVTSATEFPPKPNIHTCRYCPFKVGPMGKDGPKGTGHCTLNPV